MSHDLIEITEHTHDVILDLVYATENNFTGKKIYTHPRCFLHKDMHPKLELAIHQATTAGYRLKIFDAYRPMDAAQIFWDAVQDPRYVARPEVGSMHTRGVAIDLTLVDRETDEPLDMGTGFDDFSNLAHHFNKDLPRNIQRNRLLLLGIMCAAGFDKLETEWWHYQAYEAMKYPLISDDILPEDMHLMRSASQIT